VIITAEVASRDEKGEIELRFVVKDSGKQSHQMVDSPFPLARMFIRSWLFEKVLTWTLVDVSAVWRHLIAMLSFY
jgi:hypothetical protein